MRRAGSPNPAGRGLTPRRRQIVETIDDSVRRNGYPPSMREIGDAVGLASTSSVSYQLSVLEQDGYLSRAARRPRTAALRAPASEPAVAQVPLVGQVAAGDAAVGVAVAASAWRENTSRMVRIPAASSANCIAR